MNDLLERVRDELSRRNLYQVAVQTGISYGSVRSIAHGDTDPRWSTLSLIAEHLNIPQQESRDA